MLLIAAANSSSRIIAIGESKAFCEIDCHVVDHVIGLRRVDDTVIVSVREQFDPSTISPSRGIGALYPGGRRFALVDSSGEEVEPASISTAGNEALFSSLKLGEYRRAELRFVVSDAARVRGLLVEDDSPVSPLLIGHVRSFFT